MDFNSSTLVLISIFTSTINLSFLVLFSFTVSYGYLIYLLFSYKQKEIKELEHKLKYKQDTICIVFSQGGEKIKDLINKREEEFHSKSKSN